MVPEVAYLGTSGVGMKTGRNLKMLICGKNSNLGDLSQIFLHLGSTILFFGDKSSLYITEKLKANITEYGPFTGRRLLESACTVLLGRIDPFRLLIIKKYQSQPNFDIGTRGKLSIQWSSDIIPTKPPTDLWSQNIDSKDVSRALLSAYTHEIYWQNAFIAMLDDLSAETSQWLNELSQIQPEGITAYFRREADRLFSALSKGIHTEFVVPNTISYDAATVIDLLESTLCLITKMSIIANYIPVSLVNLSKKEIVRCLNGIESEVLI